MKLSLAGKIVAVIMGISSIALLLACLALLAYDTSTARATLTRDMGILADAVGANSTAALAFGDVRAGAATLATVDVNTNVRVAALLKNGVVFARFDRRPSTARTPIATYLPDGAVGGREPLATFADDSLRVVHPIVDDGELLGAVYIESSLDELHARLRRLGAMMALVLSGSLALAFVLASKLQRLISGPVLRLTDVTRAVSRDRSYGVRVARAGDDEVGVLIDGFNQMLSEIQRRDLQLVDHQNALERDVAIRTADLQEANHQLSTARDSAMEGSRAKSEFLANMSHEIRTPMNGIIGMTELALDSNLTVDQRSCLDTVKNSAEALLALLNDILDFSKIESQKLALEVVPFSLIELVEATLRPLALQAHAKGLEIVLDVAPDVPAAIAADPGRLRQIIGNLVGNAIKFTAQGHVVVRVACEERVDERVRLAFSVTDTGIGIAGDKHHAIFEPFRQADGSTTRRFGGTGLGLSICATLVGLMHGRIWLESESGRGSRFHFTIEAGLADLPVIVRDRPLSGLSILVVDDLELNRHLLTSRLASLQITATAVGTGRAALTALTDAAMRGHPYDIALIDARMPAMDGFTLAAQMSAHPETNIRSIMMLASSDQFGDVARCHQLGVREHVMKPVEQAGLLDAIARTVRPPPSAMAVTPPGAMATSRIGVRILLAEDNPINQRVAVGLLTRRGHTVDVANNGIEALEALRRASYDVVLMDIQMPEMGGIEATRQIRRQEVLTGGHLTIIAITAHAMKGDREEYLAAGMDGYLSKPVNPKALLAAVEQGVAGGAQALSSEATADRQHSSSAVEGADAAPGRAL